MSDSANHSRFLPRELTNYCRAGGGASCDSWCIAVVCVAIVGVPPVLKIFTSLLLRHRQRERESAKGASLILPSGAASGCSLAASMPRRITLRLSWFGESGCLYAVFVWRLPSFTVPSVEETGWTTVITSQK